MLQQNLAAIRDNRLNSDPLPGGSAPYTSSELFKLRKHKKDTSKAKCWNHRFSLETVGRYDSTLKAASLLSTPLDMVSLGTARPSPEYYPWSSLAMRALDSRRYPDSEVSSSATSMTSSIGDSAYNLGIALNYGYAAGSPQVLRFVTEHVELTHNPPYEDWESCLTSGTTSAIEIVFRMFCNRGAWIIAEEHTYSGAAECAKHLGLNVLGIKMDEQGLLPDDLDAKLLGWDTNKGSKPFVLYTIPSGQNPTGATQKTQRRREIYAVAEKHDLLIIEDDPYYLLHLGAAGSPNDPESVTVQPEEYMQHLPVSYLSMDLVGRVIRLDSTSKILAPGLRCGWITASAQIIGKFLNHTEFGTVSPSGPSQVMLYKLLDESWGHEGLIRWLIYLSSEYRRRRDVIVAACERHLPSKICRWSVPTVGMFLWIRLDCSQHPTSNCKVHCHGQEALSPRELEDQVYTAALKNGVAISKGSWFSVSSDREPSDEIFLRVTFVAAAENALECGIERLGGALKSEFMQV